MGVASRVVDSEFSLRLLFSQLLKKGGPCFWVKTAR